MSVTLTRVEPSIAGVGDYIELMKPRVMSLVVFTALVGLLIAPGHVHPMAAFTALLCIAVGAGAAGALNMWYDADIDAKMRRTRSRPVPAGRVQGADALALGVVLSMFSVMLMGMALNWLAADEEMISIRPKDPEDRRIQLTNRQMGVVRYTTLMLLPLLIALAGFSVWWQRR